jgi:CubicO group peptidase (beta-lactamase class C family)
MEIPENLQKTCGLIAAGGREGWHPGAQVCVWQAGRSVVDWAWGEAAPGVPMRTDSLVHWLSMTKPVVAVGVARCVEEGGLRLDDPVARYVPEFAVHGKDTVMVGHLLTHTCGFRQADLVAEELPWAELVARVCGTRMEPRWVPGEKAGYHLGGSWIMLGELIRRVTGQPVDEWVREQIFEPLGMKDCWLGIPLEKQADYGERISPTYLTENGTAGPHPVWSSPEGVARVLPGSNGRGPVGGLVRFYRALLNGGELDGVRILREETVREWTGRRRCGMFDHTFKCVFDWGYGFAVNTPPPESGSLPYGFGPHASPDTFGHGGSQCATAFADPAHGLVVAVAFNGRPGEMRHHARMRAVLSALYEDLGWVQS